MNTNNISSTGFGIKISPQLQIELRNSIPKGAPQKKTNKLLLQKQTDIEKMGSDTFELDIAKRNEVNTPGLVLKNIPAQNKTFFFGYKDKRSLISLFLSLTNEDIARAQKQIGGRYIL